MPISQMRMQPRGTYRVSLSVSTVVTQCTAQYGILGNANPQSDVEMGRLTRLASVIAHPTACSEERMTILSQI